MLYRTLILLAISGWSAPLIAIESIPKAPIISSRSCPLECCSYGAKWIAHGRLVAYESPKEATEKFGIEIDEVVVAETGFVVTRKLGETKVLQTTKLGAPNNIATPLSEPLITLEPNDILYILRPQGEKCDKFWYEGRFYAAEIAPGAKGKAFAAGNPMLEILSRPEITWWVKVRNGQGQTGWVKDPYELISSAKCEKNA